MKIPTSAMRVPAHTHERFNDRIDRETQRNITYYSRHPEEIDKRLRELDEEWDIERMLEANAAALTLAGSIMGTFGSRKWLLLPITVGGFLLQHAVQGWCPPVPLLRRIGVRTPQEIEAERYALKAIRGDFKDVSSNPDDADQAAARATGRLFRRDPLAGNGRAQEHDE